MTARRKKYTDVEVSRRIVQHCGTVCAAGSSVRCDGVASDPPQLPKLQLGPVAAEGILGWVGKGNVGAPRREAPAKFGVALEKFQNIGGFINDFTVTPILHVPLPKRETPLVGNLGGQLPSLPSPFHRPWLVPAWEYCMSVSVYSIGKYARSGAIWTPQSVPRAMVPGSLMMRRRRPAHFLSPAPEARSGKWEAEGQWSVLEPCPAGLWRLVL